MKKTGVSSLGGCGLFTPSTKKESGGKPLSGVLTALREKHFGVALKLGRELLLHLFERRLGFAIDHSGDDLPSRRPGMSRK